MVKKSTCFQHITWPTETQSKPPKKVNSVLQSAVGGFLDVEKGSRQVKSHAVKCVDLNRFEIVVVVLKFSCEICGMSTTISFGTKHIRLTVLFGCILNKDILSFYFCKTP